MWWEFYTICYKEMMLQKQSDWKSKIYRIEIEKLIVLNYNDEYKYVYRLSLNQ